MNFFCPGVSFSLFSPQVLWYFEHGPDNVLGI